MLKDLINIELKDFPIKGLDVHIIKKYVVKSTQDESFLVKNYSIILIKSGKFRIRIKELTQDLGAKDIMLLPRNSYCTVLQVQGKLQLFLVCFTSDFAFENGLKKELVDSFVFLLGEPSYKINLTDKDFMVLSLIYKLIYFVNKNAQDNEVDSELMQISFNLFLYELKYIFRRYTPGLPINIDRQGSITIRFLTILAIQCKKHHNVKFYAGTLFVTPGYLNKIVKRVTGKTVKSLIIQAIINEIKDYLQNTSLSINSIAMDFEFSSVSKFSDFFKKHTSISASDYRNQNRGKI